MCMCGEMCVSVYRAGRCVRLCIVRGDVCECVSCGEMCESVYRAGKCV